MKKILYLLAVIGLGVITFIFGMRYQGYLDTKKLLVVYANMLGDQVLESNNLIDRLENSSEDAGKVRAEYNKSILVDFGCSTWLADLEETSSEDLNNFYSGVEEAFKYVDSLDNQCIKNIKSQIQRLKYGNIGHPHIGTRQKYGNIGGFVSHVTGNTCGQALCVNLSLSHAIVR